MTWHGYIAVENLALDTGQRQTLIAALRTLGPASDPSPARLNHWRPRLDGQVVIFEAAFQELALTVAAWKDRLGIIFGVDPTTIGNASVDQSYAGGTTPAVTFTYSGIDYIRATLFGGSGATWVESGDECRGYLALYQDEWEQEL